jgi:hypothetical protein
VHGCASPRWGREAAQVAARAEAARYDRSEQHEQVVDRVREALELYFEDGAVNLATLPTRINQFGQVAIDAAHRLT